MTLAPGRPHPRRWKTLHVLIGAVLLLVTVRLLFPNAISDYTRSTLGALRRWSAVSPDG